HEPEFVVRFSREATALARLDSTNVIHVYDHGEVDGQLYIATQLIDGGDLGAALRSFGPMPPGWALELVAQLASGLADAHELGLVHRDIKPSNVLIRVRDDELTGYLSDFGIVRFGDEPMTLTGSTVGTPAFMAPELHDGGEATPASDLYSLGCVLWTALTGRPVFEGASEYRIVHAHMTEPVPAFPGDPRLAAELDPLFAQLLAKDPAVRPTSARAVRRTLLALQAVARDLPALPGGAPDTPVTRLRDSVPEALAPAPPGTPPPAAGAATEAPEDTEQPEESEQPEQPTPAPRRRSRRVVGALGLVLVVLAAATGWRVVIDPDSDPAADAVSLPDALTVSDRTLAPLTVVPGAVLEPAPRVRSVSSAANTIVLQAMNLPALPVDAQITVIPETGPRSRDSVTVDSASQRIRVDDVPGGPARWRVKIDGLPAFTGTATVAGAPWTPPPTTPPPPSPPSSTPAPPSSTSPSPAPGPAPSPAPTCCTGGLDDGGGIGGGPKG
ncbi:serine/threonine-protein kinase, partial [Nocardioides sp.]|uniref:serine/threonine-protein kinase n=1 Tax=Nocardioides sp. TaxID=35761 RepID=UPI00273490F2